jgi:type VI secretion system protein ImpH
LLAEPQRYRFDAAVRVMMRAGRAADPVDAARFRSLPGLAYPPADITGVRDESGSVPRVTTPVMGLTGPTGVMPRFYTEVLGATLRDRSRALHDFLDLLSHRMVGAFARAGIKYRLHRAADAALLTDPPAPDRVEEALLAFTGYATPHLAGRVAAGTSPLLHYAGMMSMRPRSAERLAAMVSDWLGRKVEVMQFAGAWLPLPPDQRTRMPVGRRPGAWNRLGVDAAIGVRSWDVQARIILRIGPLDRAGFEALLPNGRLLPRLVSLVRAYLGYETGFAVNPVLAASEIPPLRLHHETVPSPRLGWNTWIVPPGAAAPGGRRRSDAAEAVFEAEIVEASGVTLAREGQA